MGMKKDPYANQGKKLFRLFTILLASSEGYSLTELTRKLACSKQTVLRLLDDLEDSGFAKVLTEFRGNRKFVRLKKSHGRLPALPLTENEVSILQMCRDFTAHVLGKELFMEASQAIMKSQALLPSEDQSVASKHFGTLRSGYVDYGAHHETIRTLIAAMDQKKVCRVVYGSGSQERKKTFYIRPLKMFSYENTIYLHAQMAKDPERKYVAPGYDPVLAVHRIANIEVTDMEFDYPEKYDFDKAFNQTFGVMKGDPFQVEVEFTGWAAQFVSERQWSQGQKITEGDGKLVLSFTAASVPEVVSWVLGFGSNARVFRPDWLVKEIEEEIRKTESLMMT